MGAMSLRRALLLTAALVGLGWSLAPDVARAREPAPLTGVLRIATCGDFPCPLPPAHDPRWSSFALGPAGLASSLDQEEGIVWVVVTFTQPPEAAFAHPALLITHPADAEEAFLNGMRVGGSGSIGPRFATTVAGPRVLTLPPGSLRGGENELALLALLSGRNVRVFTGPFVIGERDRIAADAAHLTQPTIASESAFLSMFLVVFVFYGFLVLKRVVRSDYLFFLMFTAVYTGDFLLGSHFLHQDGVVESGLVHAQAVLGSLRGIVMLTLVTHATGSGFGFAYRCFATVAAAFVALDLALPPLTVLMSFELARKVFLGLLGVYYLIVAVLAVKRRREDSIPVLAGVACYVLGSRLDLLWGIAVRDYATGAFALCMLFALTSRHARLRNRLEEISTRLLDAHDEERRRIARDIHDGIGQSLLALRLRLQQWSARASKGVAVGPEPLEALAADTGTILEDIRRLSMDLRPSFVESMTLSDLLRWYGSSFAEMRGLSLHVHAGARDVPEPAPRVKDNLYRIYQEILTNVAKHAGATRVDVSLYRGGRSLVLEVADNGQGFEEDGGARGIGLETMRERAELIGGSCRVESVAGRGTKVTVEVPAP